MLTNLIEHLQIILNFLAFTVHVFGTALFILLHVVAKSEDTK